MKYLKNEAIKIKSINGTDGCLVLVPGQIGFHRLNTSAWFILESCTNIDLEEIVIAYEGATGQKLQGEYVRVAADRKLTQ